MRDLGPCPGHETADIGCVAFSEYPGLRITVRVVHIVDLHPARGFEPPPLVEDAVAVLRGFPLTHPELVVVVTDATGAERVACCLGEFVGLMRRGIVCVGLLDVDQTRDEAQRHDADDERILDGLIHDTLPAAAAVRISARSSPRVRQISAS